MCACVCIQTYMSFKYERSFIIKTRTIFTNMYVYPQSYNSSGNSHSICLLVVLSYTNYFIDVTLYVCHFFFFHTLSLSPSLPRFVIAASKTDRNVTTQISTLSHVMCTIKLNGFSFSYIFFLSFFESVNIKMTLFGVRRCIGVPFFCWCRHCYEI